MTNRPNLIATALCVLLFTSVCSVQAQLFKKKELPSFQGEKERKGLKILSSFGKDRSDPIEVVTSVPGSGEILDLQPTTIEPSNKKSDRKFKFPVKVPTPFKKDPSVPVGEVETLENRNGVLVSQGEQVENVVFTPNKNSTNSNPEPPRKEDGSVIYNDWDDVKAYESSAAQQIVWQLKKQEADHKRKQAAAEKALEAQMAAAEAQMKKAQEEQRKRALLQGGGNRLPRF